MASSVSHLDPMPKVSIRAADDTAAAHALGLAFGSAEHRNDTLVVRIRPDEWYLLGAGGHALAVDITHARHAIRVTGTHAADTLAKLCSADFDDAMTPNGAAWGNSIAGVTCDIVRDDNGGERSYLLLFDGSFVAYFHGVLEDAAGEFSSDA